jgi:hypothetical protein
MGFFDDLLGNTAADAAKQAAADTYGKQQAATAGIRNYGDTYAGQFRDLANSQTGSWAPYTQGGASALDMLLNSLGLNGQSGTQAAQAAFQAGPGYQFTLDQGLKALNQRRALGGMLGSGNADQDAIKYATGLADQTWNNWLSGLSGVTNTGLTATGQQTGQYLNTVGTGLQGQLATQNAGYLGDMQSAGTIGQGDVAAAQAKAAGAQNLLGMVASVAGSALGGGLGGGMGSLLSAGGSAGSAIPGSFGATSFGGANGPTPLTGGSILGRLLGF